MFKSTARLGREATGRGDATRERVLAIALDLFRERGYDGTSMREVAAAAGLAPGAAYYYFPSKQHLVLTYYRDVQSAYAEQLAAALGADDPLAKRLETAFQLKLDIVRDDRRMLKEVFAATFDTDSPLSVFSRESAPDREQSIAAFGFVLGRQKLSPALRDVAPRLLWLLHLLLLFLFLKDPSPRGAKARALVTPFARVFVTVLRILDAPGFGGVRRRTVALSRQVQDLLEAKAA